MNETNECKPRAGDRASYPVTAAVFAEVWQTSASLHEAAERLGMPMSICSARASFYRRSGVQLKRMANRRPPLDVAGLNRILQELDAAGREPPETGDGEVSGFLDPTGD
ncbi:MAG TPA: hypothetical protein VJ739_13880 [Gemmataceae bacterium]|nr:hypothetical protein [Gemmataceae bacterium]